MRVNEILGEDEITDKNADDISNTTNLSVNLLPVLMFLKKRSEDRGISPTMRTDSLIQLVQNAGDNTFNYQSLVDAQKNNDAVKELIKNFNRDDITLRSDDDTADAEQEETQADMTDQERAEQNPEEVVSGMAKSAANKRQ